MSDRKPRLDFARNASSPSLEAGALGVAIRVEATFDQGAVRKLVLRGAYAIAPDEARAIGVIPLQRALVVTVTSGRTHRAWNLAGDALAFADDESVGAGVVRGYFNADLTEGFPLAPYATGYLLVSLGESVSNVETITAR